jgi:hypothetical protein
VSPPLILRRANTKTTTSFLEGALGRGETTEASASREEASELLNHSQEHIGDRRPARVTDKAYGRIIHSESLPIASPPSIPVYHSSPVVTVDLSHRNSSPEFNCVADPLLAVDNTRHYP